jgi:hypothetical protein
VTEPAASPEAANADAEEAAALQETSVSEHEEQSEPSSFHEDADGHAETDRTEHRDDEGGGEAE